MSRIDELQAKLAARKDQPGFKANVQAIKAEIAKLTANSEKAEI